MAKYCHCEHFYDMNAFVEGARVKFRELPIRIAKELGLVLDEDFTIKRCLIKVNSLGDLMTVVELDQLPGVYVSPNILTLKTLSGTEPVIKSDDRTIRNMINTINDLNAENQWLSTTLHHGVLKNFDKK